MAGGRVTPRQKMINMMYLVLTAMLALNVSAEVLEAFVKIEESLGNTVIITGIKNDQVVQEIEAARETQEEKVKEWADRAAKVRNRTKSVIDSINDIKIALVKHVDGGDESKAIDSAGNIIPSLIGAKDNSNGGDQFFIIQKKGYQLEQLIKDYKQSLLDEVKSFDRGNLAEEIERSLNLEVRETRRSGEGKERRNWVQFTFEGTPLIANIATISKLQMDVLLAETSVLNALRGQIGKTDFKISTIVPMVNNPSGAILKGSSAKAEVFLAAYDASMNPEITIGGSKIPVRDGKGIVTLTGNSIGPQVLSGIIKFQGPEGENTERFTIPYHVIEPNFVASPTKMNVFYLGVDNPVEISVAGVPIDKVSVSVQNGSITGSGSSRNFIPAAVGEARISVSAEIDGKTQPMGSRSFRVKRVPDPAPQVLGITGKTTSKATLASSQGVIAKMPEDFDFDLKFTVTSFTVSVIQDGFLKDASSNSAAFTQQQRDLMKESRVNRVLITNIKASGPGGVRDLGDLVYTVR